MRKLEPHQDNILAGVGWFERLCFSRRQSQSASLTSCWFSGQWISSIEQVDCINHKSKYSEKNSVILYAFYQTVSTTSSCRVGHCNGKRQHPLCFDGRAGERSQYGRFIQQNHSSYYSKNERSCCNWLRRRRNITADRIDTTVTSVLLVRIS